MSENGKIKNSFLEIKF